MIRMKTNMLILAAILSAQLVMAEDGKSEGNKSEGGNDQNKAVVDVTPNANAVQSPVRPFGLDIASPVYQAASDARSADFLKNTLPVLNKLLNQNLREYTSFKNVSSAALDPAKLKLAVDSMARVYFVGEGAGYQNTLGFNTLSSPATSGTPGITKTAQLIFPNASSNMAGALSSSTGKERTLSEPLQPGDFSDLGSFKAGSSLDFFLVSYGATGGKSVLTANAQRNTDGLQHVVAFASPDSPFLLMAFEDMLGGGDRDYNDVIFALDIGKVNVARLVSAPEPAFWAMLVGMMALVVWRKKDCFAPAII
jgi:hypothetical protein